MRFTLGITTKYIDRNPEGFRSIENKIFPTDVNKNKPRSDLRDAKQQTGKQIYIPL
jgi:hypothetical protein